MLIGIDASRAARAGRTGTENYSLQLVRALLAQCGSHRWRLYTNGAPSVGLFRDAEASCPVEICSIPFPRLWTHVRLASEVARRPPDLLFVPAHVLPLLYGGRSVVTIHDLGYRAYPSAHRTLDRLYLDWSTRWSARRATALLVDSAATMLDLERAYGINRAKMHVVHLGRDPALRRIEDPEAVDAVRCRYGLAQGYLLYVGTLQPRKNLGRLLRAFACVAGHDSMLGVELVLAGRQGWLYADLLAERKRLGLDERIRFVGYVPDENLAALYSGALGCVFPSLCEGFGMPVLEAQACGVPVVTSNNSSLPEVAGDAALFVDPHDVDAISAAIYRIATEPTLREDLAQRGLENVKRFSWEKCARETLAVLEEIAIK